VVNFWRPVELFVTRTIVSVQTTLASVQSISSGLEQVKSELRLARDAHLPGDRFLAVMEVWHLWVNVVQEIDIRLTSHLFHNPLQWWTL
jgi:hypothetical protein